MRHSHRHCDHAGDDGFCARWRLEKATPAGPQQPPAVADALIGALSQPQPRCVRYPADSLFAGLEGSSIYERQAALLWWFMGVARALHPALALDAFHAGEGDQLRLIRQVLAYLEARSAEDINVADLAASVGYSYRHLARLFKEKTGSTIIEKLNSIRISKAIHLLESTDLPVGTICERVGFHSEPYFSTIFSNYTHMPPSVFRSRHGKG